MKMRNLFSLGIVAMSLAMAGCQTGTPGGSQQAGTSVVEGEWIGTDGVAISSLQGGRFSSRAIQTGEMLTEGSYTQRDQSTIDLSFYSLKSQTNTTATCMLVSASQMNCTLANGTNFVLTRRVA